MGRLTLNSIEKKNTETLVSNVFFDFYMKDASGEFVKVYLYLLRCMSDSSIPAVSVSDIADHLNLVEKDVIRALRYWVSVNAMAIDFDEVTGEPSSITFLPLSPDRTDTVTAVSAKSEDIPQAASLEADNSQPEKIHYSPAQLKEIRKREDIKQLLFIAEHYIGKTLTGAEISTILYIQDALGFSSELIEYLIEYCVSNDCRSLKYIEKVALAWHEKGIVTVGAAKEENQLHSRMAYAVSKAFGIKDRCLSPVEMELVNKWHMEFGFDEVMVTEACQRTILSMGKPNFNYADGIFKKWHAAGIHNMEDLKKLDAGFRGKVTVPVGTRPATRSTNKFNGYSAQRQYNFDEMEKNLISNNKK